MSIDLSLLSSGAVTKELMARQRRLADDLGRNTVGNADAAYLPNGRAPDHDGDGLSKEAAIATDPTVMPSTRFEALEHQSLGADHG
jgi:hypothetical protein